MAKLVWTREQDGEHSGKPCYEYSAASEDGQCEYFIVWAYDRGGSFGFTAVRRDPEKPGTVEYLTERNGIVWGRTLTRCKAECEKINERYQNVA